MKSIIIDSKIWSILESEAVACLRSMTAMAAPNAVTFSKRTYTHMFSTTITRRIREVASKLVVTNLMQTSLKRLELIFIVTPVVHVL